MTDDSEAAVPASDDGIEGPPPAAAAVTPPSRSGLLVKATALVVGLAAVGAIGVAATSFFQAHVASPATAVIESMVPSDMDGLLVVNIDPSVSQKANLFTSIHKFPNLKTPEDVDKQIAKLFDTSLKDLGGATYQADIKPWVGRTVTITGQVQKAPTLPAVLMVSSRDNRAAKAFLDRLRKGTPDGGTWTSHVHGAVTVWTKTLTRAATPSVNGSLLGNGSAATSPAEVDFALVGDTVVFAGQSALVDEIIDTNAGSHPRLKDSPGYAAALSHIPADRLAYGYVNTGPFLTHVAELSKQMSPATSGQGAGADALQNAKAFGGAAFALTARVDGIQGDAWAAMDASKLDPLTKAALAPTTHNPSLMARVPAGATLVFAGSGLKAGIHSALQQYGSSTSPLMPFLGQLHLNDPAGPASHLGDDYGLELDKLTGDQYVGGTLMAATDDPGGTQILLSQLVGAAASLGAQFAAPGGRAAPRSAVNTETYKGTTISSVVLPGADLLGIIPAYAVTNGVAVIGSSPAHVKATIDAATGPGITQSAPFKSALAGSLDPSATVFYVDFQGIQRIVDAVMPPSARADLDSWLTPLQSLAATSRYSAESSTSRFTILVR